jgi:SNF2 family DNA or RNA helicase
LQSWIDEIELNAPQLTYKLLIGSTQERERLLYGKPVDFYLINYPGLQFLMSSLAEVRGKKKRRRQVDPKLAGAVASRFDMAVFDESQKIGNSQSLVYRLCRHFTKHCRFRYALTGTPMGRDPTMLWSQFHVVDNGATLGDTLGLFRAAFFNASDNYWGGIDYTFDSRMEGELNRLLKNSSIYYQDSEFSDMPPVPPAQRIKVRFSTSAKEQYNGVVRRIKETYGSIEERKSSFVRMRMCTSGYLSVKSDIEGRLTMYFDENPKLEWLEEMVAGIPYDSKLIIYHEYILTGKLICRILDRIKLPYATLSGQTKDQLGEMRRFLKDDKVRFLVANNETGSTGINPQEVANYMVFYESPVSPITRKQAIKRLHRTGQKKHCHFYDFIVPNTVDEDILESLEKGKNLFDAVIQGKAKFEEVE